MPEIDHDLLRRLQLHSRPRGQVIFANTVLALDYRFPRRTQIKVEGLEHVPTDGGAILAMNHTDRFNYWPFQYRMYRDGLPFTATWVKGKYYENDAMAWFLNHTNNIPLPSRGYLLTTSFRRAVGRVPEAAEYRYLRSISDGERLDVETPSPEVASLVAGDPAAWAEVFESEFESMMREVMRLNEHAVRELGLNLLVFPEGTRSVRLGGGHTGLVEVSQHLGLPIVPVGCNGSDRVYPGNSPFASGGDIVYRVGRPLTVDDPAIAAHRITDGSVPFSLAMKRKHGPALRAVTDVVMARILALLDPRHHPDPDAAGADGASRFV